MKYALVNKKKGEERGFDAYLHTVTKKGEMVLNENELLEVNPDIDKAAAELGGKVYTEDALINILNNK